MLCNDKYSQINLFKDNLQKFYITDITLSMFWWKILILLAEVIGFETVSLATNNLKNLQLHKY